MNWVRRTALIIALLIVVVCAFNAKKSLDNFIEIDKKSSYSSTSTNIHSFAFTQPQSSTAFILHYKTPNCSLLKYLECFLVVIPAFRIKILFNRFANQDINRCKMVSLLLFPYHSFW